MRRAVFAGLIVVAACGGGAGGGGGDDEPPPRDAEIHVVSGTTTSEAGATAEIGVSLSDAPTAPVVIAIQSDDPGEGAVSPATIRFEAGDVGPHTVVVTGVDDAEVDGAQPYRVVFAAAVSDDAGYAGLIVPPVALTNVDDDVGTGTVRVFLNGPGAGTVTSAPAGIACPGVCVASFPAGTTVTLTAAAGTGSRFGGWRVPGVDFTPTRTFEIGAGELHQANGLFVRDQLAWTAAVDGPAVERLDVVAAAGDQLVVGGELDGPTTIGGTPLPYGGGRDPLIAAYAAADGAFRWSRSFGGTGDARVQAIAILPGGDVVVGGWFTGELDLGAGPVTPSSTTGGFVARLRGADGAVVWAKALTAGPSVWVAGLGASPDGGIVACGSGTAPLAWLDGDGGLVAAITPGLMAGCVAIDRRAGGWVAVGEGAGGGSAVYVSVDDDRHVDTAESVFATSASMRINDIVALPTGGAIVLLAVTMGVGLYDHWMTKVDAAGNVVGSISAASSNYSDRSSAAVLEAPDSLLVARQIGAGIIVLERYDISSLMRVAGFDLGSTEVFDFDLATSAGHTFLAGDSFTTEPLIGWPMMLQNDGGFVSELKLP